MGAKTIALIALLLLTGCSATLEDYQNETPVLRLEQFFSGPLEAYGIVQDRRGVVLRRFRADLIGHWQGDRGVLDEQFYFADGEQQNRCWQLERDGRVYTGQAGDVIGQAEGKVSGNALYWQYQLAVPVDGDTWHLELHDWMYLVDEQNLINRAEMRKFGVKVGDITLYIRKLNKPQIRPMTAGCQLAEGTGR